MGKAMVNATNLVAHATIMAHLNPKTNNDKSCMPWASSCICNKSNSCCAAIWYTINGMMKTLNPNPNPNLTVGPCDTWQFKLSKY
jgi:hypothetical protein